ncbi:hypothetical protein Plano_2311 [Planococcus sp. PAMC 21323]|nr:hypothetical protein Plano_2311 [Planococcus sp. PAMC 21323]
MSLCDRCEKKDAYIHWNSTIKSERLCLSCYNLMLTDMLSVEATSYPDGVTIQDGEGEPHHFRLRKTLDPIGVIMEAEELVDGGYQFTVHGELDVDQGQLFLELIAKAERGMAEIYIQKGEFPNGQHFHSLINDRLVGRIESDLSDDQIPLVAVDGKSYTWNEVGKMLMSYEGFQVKLEMIDRFEEIEWENGMAVLDEDFEDE